jgi:hypothetical protein
MSRSEPIRSIRSQREESPDRREGGALRCGRRSVSVADVRGALRCGRRSEAKPTCTLREAARQHGRRYNLLPLRLVTAARWSGRSLLCAF